MGSSLDIVPIMWAVVQMFGMFGLGALFRRLGYIHEEEVTRWSHFVIDGLFPFLVFHAVVTGAARQELLALWVLPVLGFGCMALGAVLGFPLAWGLHSKDPDVKRTFHHLACVNNYGFLPLFVLQNLWGAAAVAKLMVFNIGSSLAYWTIGVALLGQGDWRRRLRHLLTSNLAALGLALALVALGWQPYVPEVVLKVSAVTGGIAVPLITILIGASLGGMPAWHEARDLAYMTVVRLAIVPAATIVLLKLLPLSESTYALALIVALMPVSASSPIATRRFGGSPEFAGRAAVITTLACLGTIPLTLWLLS